jgi:hypothetical protein
VKQHRAAFELGKRIEGGSGELIWIISGLYLLAMVWFLLSTMGGYGAHETKQWLAPAVVAFTVSYGVLMLLLWPHEKSHL